MVISKTVHEGVEVYLCDDFPEHDVCEKLMLSAVHNDFTCREMPCSDCLFLHIDCATSVLPTIQKLFPDYAGEHPELFI